jgi:FkbM family methyltransferase
MNIVSYAQTYEDILLWRALKHVARGFYIDVGANDPEADSVTKIFYDHGWHGINVEPLPAYQRQLEQQRPRDVNLAVAAGAVEGTLTLFDFPAMRGWASPDAVVAASHREHGLQAVELRVPVQTLAHICARHVDGDIHFLKIDVEGFEAEVIRGMDFARWRPWIVIVEATLPNSQIANFAAWEDALVAHLYHYAYFDGLNRYYVAAEHQELAAALTVQPNVFDDFITAGQLHAELSQCAAEKQAQRADAAARRVAAAAQIAHRAAEQAQQTAQQMMQRALVAEDAARQTAAEIAAIHASRAWKATLLLRWGRQAVSAAVRNVRARLSAMRAAARRAPQALVRAVLPSDGLYTSAGRKLAAFPRIERLARALAFHFRKDSYRQATSGDAELEDLTPLPATAGAVFEDLQRAIAARKSAEDA